MTENSAGGGTSGDSPDSTPEELRAELEQKRKRLGDTVEELAGRADVKARAQEKATEAKISAKLKAAEVRDRVQEKVGQASQLAQEKVGQAQEKVGQVSHLAQEKAGYASLAAQEKAGQAAHAVQERTPDQVQDQARALAVRARDNRTVLLAVGAGALLVATVLRQRRKRAAARSRNPLYALRG